MGTPGSLILPGEGSCCWHCRHRHPSSVRQANKFRVGFAPGRCFAPLVMPAATASIHSAAAAANGPFQDRAAIHKPGTLPPQACPSRSPHAAGAQRDLPAAGLLRSPASARIYRQKGATHSWGGGQAPAAFPGCLQAQQKLLGSVSSGGIAPA